MVETLSAFRSEIDISGTQFINFVFPMAPGNLKRLFRGDYDDNLAFQGQRQRRSLWTQYAGLASAVLYLHESLNTAHRDLKPSDILIYHSTPPGELILKVTNFVLSVDLKNANSSFELGSLALQSAWTYDDPELRRASPQTIGDEAEPIKIPTARVVGKRRLETGLCLHRDDSFSCRGSRL